MITNLWFTILYQPVINALVWIYSNIAGENLGWAVVWLTVILRIVLLPLTIKSEKDAHHREKLEKDTTEEAEAYKGDLIAQKEAIRKAMKRNKISPWAKSIALAIQFLMLVLLYQVFISGIEGHKIIISLYEFVDYPGKLNAMFYGFHIGVNHNYVWAGIVTAYLIFMIMWGNRNKKWTSGKATFLVLFPLAVFIALWVLPMVKSIFILTSMVFSDIIGVVIRWFLPKEAKEADTKIKK